MYVCMLIAVFVCVCVFVHVCESIYLCVYVFVCVLMRAIVYKLSYNIFIIQILRYLFIIMELF